MLLRQLLTARSLLGVAFSVGLWGCAEPQRPYQFTTPQMAREPIEALAAALTQAGHGPIVVDPKTGTVTTRWVDTGVHSGLLQEQEATVVLRYSATITRGAFGNEVTVAANAKRCAVHNFTLTEIDVQGTCAPMTRLLPQHQEELYRLGQRVQQAMSIP